MPYPYFVHTKIKPVDLYQLNDGRFQMIKQGCLAPLMCGYEYVIVENKFGDYLDTLDIQNIELQKVIIWNRQTNEEYRNYKQILFDRHFSLNQMNDLNIDGLRVMLVMLMNNYYLFVSPKLKQILETSEFDCLLFSEGFSQFAGKDIA